MKAKKKVNRFRYTAGSVDGPKTKNYIQTKEKQKGSPLESFSNRKTKSVSYTNLDKVDGSKPGTTNKTKVNYKGKSKSKVISTKKAERQMSRKNKKYTKLSVARPFTPSEFENTTGLSSNSFK